MAKLIHLTIMDKARSYEDLVNSLRNCDIDDGSSNSLENINTDSTIDADSTSSISPVLHKRTGGVVSSIKKISQNTKFMENFDPERSNRERRKLTRKITTQGKKPTLYDENGLLGTSQKDVCDCLEEACPGCHFPCPKCRSNKCGHECRVSRKWMYEEIVIEGLNETIYNPLFTK